MKDEIDENSCVRDSANGRLTFKVGEFSSILDPTWPTSGWLQCLNGHSKLTQLNEVCSSQAQSQAQITLLVRVFGLPVPSMKVIWKLVPRRSAQLCVDVHKWALKTSSINATIVNVPIVILIRRLLCHNLMSVNYGHRCQPLSAASHTLYGGIGVCRPPGWPYAKRL